MVLGHHAATSPVRIFLSPLVAGEVAVRGDEHHYLARVRRARVGDSVELVNGAGASALAQIMRVARDETLLAVGAPVRVVESPPHMRTLIPWIKGDRMAFCLEKLVEVGANEIVIWPAARAVVRVEADRIDARLARARDTVRAASRQSGRAWVPTVTSATSLAAILEALAPGARVVLDPDAETTEIGRPADLTMISGPEGGFEPSERETLARAGFTALCLGPRTLRAETAPMIAVALARAAFGT
jgi:16S rRNA (uracil1498-N3)-methyltransferase